MGNAQLITAVVSNEQGEIFDLEGYAAVGMAGDSLFPLTDAGTVDLPFGSELMRLPDRVPVLYDMESGRFEIARSSRAARGAFSWLHRMSRRCSTMARASGCRKRWP